MPPPKKSAKSSKQKSKLLKDNRREATVQSQRERDSQWLQARVDSGSYIIADPAKQAPHNSYSPPKFYADLYFSCVDCGKVELWTARQQQWWYEVTNETIYSRAVRCRKCRRRKREQSKTYAPFDRHFGRWHHSAGGTGTMAVR